MTPAAARSWQDVLLGAAVMAPREVPRARSVLALLARFAAGRGIPAAPALLLDYNVVEAFCVHGCAGRASSTRGTCRPVLYQLAGQVHGEPGQRATPFAGAKAPAPYSAAERAGLAAVARAQRDPAKRSSALAVVVFGIGAGLRPGELAALYGSNVVRRGGRVVVQVSGGPVPRVVPVAPRYAGRALSMSRARSSFLCDHLAAGAPLPVLLAMAGIAEAESLARYARHVPGMTSSKAALRARWRAEATR